MGSTYTKGSLIDSVAGEVSARAQVPTTISTDVWDGVCQVREELASGEPDTPAAHDRDRVWLCSSAGGGLRLAVVGFERVVSAEAGRWVALSAGARIVYVSDRDLSADDIEQLRAAHPDLVLLVGGTNGGNSGTLLRNAETLGAAQLHTTMVVAGNNSANEQARDIITAFGGTAMSAENVLPRIGQLAPESARAAIREAFLRHVIGGSSLSLRPEFAASVRAPTPDAVLDGVAVIRDVADQDVLVLDIGGATTDVYSAVIPQGEDAMLAKEVVGRLPLARSVEADLGMRHSAPGILEAARSEGLAPARRGGLDRWIERVHKDPDLVPSTEAEARLDAELARLAAVLAARRHGRPATPGATARPLTEVGVVIGSGGVLRHAPVADAQAVLHAVIGDVGGGWRPPDRASVIVDTGYLLGAIGLLAHDWPHLATDVARTLLGHTET